jgi:hypothetical protein
LSSLTFGLENIAQHSDSLFSQRTIQVTARL